MTEAHTCTNCGGAVDSAATFCSTCGTAQPSIDNEQESTQQASASREPPAPPPPPHSDPIRSASTRSPHRAPPTIMQSVAIGAAGLILAVVGISLATGGDPNGGSVTDALGSSGVFTSREGEVESGFDAGKRQLDDVVLDEIDDTGVATESGHDDAAGDADSSTPTGSVTTAITGGDAGIRLLDPVDVGLDAIYEVSDDAFTGSQTTARGDYPIDCGFTYSSEAFAPRSREATTWLRDTGNWFEVVDVFESSAESASLMDAISAQLEGCLTAAGGLRPFIWFERSAGSTPVQGLGDETWSGESLLGSGSGADHTIFTVTRIGNVIVYTQMYSRRGEIIDRSVAWDLARRAVEQATG